MSNYHILDTNDKQTQVNVAFHITIPNEINISGISLSTVISQSLQGTEQISRVPWLITDFLDEYNDIQAGVIYEHYETVTVLIADSNLIKQNKIDQRYNILNTRIPNIIRQRFKFWGINRNII